MNKDIQKYNKKQVGEYKRICATLAKEIDGIIKSEESKIWHGGPVWFIDGNPIVGYNVRKDRVTLLFWSGQSFKEPGLKKEGSFKASEANYVKATDIKVGQLRRWLRESKKVQWDYKNIVKRRGVLKRIS